MCARTGPGLRLLQHRSIDPTNGLRACDLRYIIDLVCLRLLAADGPIHARRCGLSSNDYSKTTAVVTGASSGIGQAVAIALAAAGVERLLVHYCKNEAGALQTASAASKHGADVVLHSADLSSPEDSQQLADVAFDKLGVIHTWVNNAGADVLTGKAGDWSFEEKLQHLLSVDVVGTIRLSRQVGERLALQSLDRPPSMLFIGWDQAPQGMEGDAGQMFATVKAAVMAYANSLAQSLAPQVRVNTIAPGWIRTKWGESTSEYWDRRAKQQALMARWGEVDDVAMAVVFACDPANVFMTSQTIEVNGGWNRRHDT